MKVLELGCGEDIGTVMFTEGGNEVTGVDFDGEAIDHAKRTLEKTGIHFVCADFLGKTYGSFDAVISLDVIEHIPKSREDKFLRTISMNLKPDGFCVVGTPNDTASQYASEAKKAAHVNLFTAEKLTALMNRYFRNVFLFGMND
ncbi:class I SAM-dependent methyltransferase [Candidatus Bipolaricaulota bacterium]|nr:class I SAM-dependent methyltransferase [Candidatus Bipolaricaulota bacterium]